MISITAPSELDLAAFRLRQSRLELTYPSVGCTGAQAGPSGYDADCTRVLLGQGEDVFATASQALRDWQQFPGHWVRVVPPCPEIRVGTVVVILARIWGFWFRNACRILDVVDTPRRFSFAYGTLPGHVARGEERFTVEMTETGEVWYEIRAYSRPRHLLVRLFYYMARRFQRRFARDSARTMRAIINSSGCISA